jgi:hypothetical protein
MQQVVELQESQKVQVDIGKAAPSGNHQFPDLKVL